MIEEITIEGFKSLRSVKALELRSINVLIGANGSGKSNFLSAFSLLRAVRSGRLSEFVRRRGGAERRMHYGSDRTDRMSLRFRFPGALSYGVRLEPAVSDRLFVEREWVESPEVGRVRIDGGDFDDDLGAETGRLFDVHHFKQWRPYGHGYANVAARIIGEARTRTRRGGVMAWPAAKRDIVRHLRGDPACVHTTIVDFYAMPEHGDKGWPGRAQAGKAAVSARGPVVERAIVADLRQAVGQHADLGRFLPYVMVHEFEAPARSDTARSSMTPRLHAPCCPRVDRDEVATV